MRRGRLLFWLGRKSALRRRRAFVAGLPCNGRHHPRHQLPHVVPAKKRMAQMSLKYGTRVTNVFHAGDGNLHR
ncbi:MAG: hypothetical protein IPK48_00150 [Gammaproteobacteria bacterium]|nr:hypothetical protein [Gammaproteobacteria bacterium]